MPYSLSNSQVSGLAQGVVTLLTFNTYIPVPNMEWKNGNKLCSPNYVFESLSQY